MIDGREYDPVAEANVTYRVSGFSNESNPTGNGGMHTTQNRKLGGFDSLPISLDPTRNDLEALQATADRGEPVPMAFIHPSGVTYAGQLTIQGAVDGSTGDGQVEITALGDRFEQV
jgi:hypothetical protein